MLQYILNRAGELYNSYFSSEKTPESPPTPQDVSYTTTSLYPLQQDDAIREAVEDLHPQTLSTILYKGIQDVHTTAVKNEFLQSLIKNSTSEYPLFCSKAYVHYLCNLFVIHEALEKAQILLAQHPQGKDFVFPSLYRSEKILQDIKVWALFNGLSKLFAKLEDSEEFKKQVRLLAEKSTHEYASHLTQINEDHILQVVGALYAFYGTLMAGGQSVKVGVQEGFLVRMRDTEWDEEADQEKIIAMKQKLPEDLPLQKTFSEQSVALFTFSHQKSIAEFKRDWHCCLDTLKISLTPEEIQHIVAEANSGIQQLLQFVEEMLENLKKAKQ